MLCSFIAPWSLKSILQFIAYRKLSLVEPDVYPPQPTHLAVTYVIAMFLGQVLASISHGYALWLGRRICVRLRAIIVTECFGKVCSPEFSWISAMTLSDSSAFLTS